MTGSWKQKKKKHLAVCVDKEEMHWRLAVVAFYDKPLVVVSDDKPPLLPIPLYIPYNFDGTQMRERWLPYCLVTAEPTILDFSRLKSQRTNHQQTICNLFSYDPISSNKCDCPKSQKSLVEVAVDAGGGWIVGLEAQQTDIVQLGQARLYLDGWMDGWMDGWILEPQQPSFHECKMQATQSHNSLDQSRDDECPYPTVADGLQCMMGYMRWVAVDDDGSYHVKGEIEKWEWL